MTNNNIYKIAKKIVNISDQINSLNLPVKFSFYFLKNKKNIFELASEIEQQVFVLRDPSLPEAEVNKKIDELLELEQEVNIYKVKLSEILDLNNLTMEQVDALMFMIDEEE